MRRRHRGTGAGCGARVRSPPGTSRSGGSVSRCRCPDPRASRRSGARCGRADASCCTTASIRPTSRPCWPRAGIGKPVVLVQHIAAVPYSNPLLRGLMRAANALDRPADAGGCRSGGVHQRDGGAALRAACGSRRRRGSSSMASTRMCSGLPPAGFDRAAARAALGLAGDRRGRAVRRPLRREEGAAHHRAAGAPASGPDVRAGGLGTDRSALLAACPTSTCSRACRAHRWCRSIRRAMSSCCRRSARACRW